MILFIRGQKVMLDADLADLYGVSSKALIQAVKRNANRFPSDFMFQLAEQEVRRLRSHFVTSIALSARNAKNNKERHDIIDKSGWLRGKGGRRHYPYAFTEQGVAMLSSVLRSSRAVNVNIEIMRAFVRLRKIIHSHADLARKLSELEKRYDAQFKIVFDAIRELMTPTKTNKCRIGFKLEKK